MPEVIYVQADGVERRVEVAEGMSVMSGAERNGVDGIVAACGGALACATCHVYVDAAWVERLPPIALEEDEMLDNAAATLRPGSRLSCQLMMTAGLAGLRVEVPDRQ